MPEAAVDKHCDAGTGKGEIRSARQLWPHTISSPRTPKRPPQGYLWAGLG
jgi:hypothetical protein